MTGVHIRLDEDIDTEGALIVCCFPSVGMVSSVVAHFLIDHLELEFIGGVTHPKLPALCLVQEGRPLPPIRAYAGSPVCKVDGCDKVILLMSELVVPDPLVHEIVSELFNWSKNAQASKGVLIDAFARKGMKGGLNGQEPLVEYEDTEEIDVLGVGATTKMVEIIESMDIPLLEQGVIKGMTGVLLGEARRRERNIMSLMVEADPRFPDARAAATVIEQLNKLLPVIDLDYEPLLAEAQMLEEQIRGMMEGTENDASSSSSSSAMYG
ncbi:MAG: PAC2 family protein [Candidatus Poseidoniaceae archaeon]|jgi:uncharacterized protein|nr:PAC2 family protein [Candidatus Poseidoniaceae archaeon]